MCKINKNDILEAKIEKLSNLGYGIAKVNGFVLFVPNSCPEDILKIKIVKLNKNFGQGEIQEILKPSPFRVEPKCKMQKVCGACHFEPSKKTDDNEDLKASGYVEGQDVMVESDGQRFNMGPVPAFEIRRERPETIVPDDPEIDERGIWDSGYKEPKMVEVDGDVEWISHMATPDEIRRYGENSEEEKEAIKICREKIAKRNLEMKLVTAHFLLCEPKVLFFFTAEDRVDFRDLVKDLVSVFRMRIELRQIGVRDESRVLGGLAVCGRDFC